MKYSIQQVKQRRQGRDYLMVISCFLLIQSYRGMKDISFLFTDSDVQEFGCLVSAEWLGSNCMSVNSFSSVPASVDIVTQVKTLHLFAAE